MKRFINVRIPVLIACFLALGVGAGYLFSFQNAEILWLIAVVPLTAIIFIFAAIFKKKKLLIVTAILAVIFVSGVLNSFIRLENFKYCDVTPDDVYTVTGTVEEKGKTSYGEYIVIRDAAANGEKLSGKVRVFLPEIYGDFCDNGYKVRFNGKLKFNDVFPYGELNYYAEDNIKYTSSPYSEIKSEYHFSLFGSIRSAIRNVLYDNLSYDTASICYGMLLGDTQNVDDEALENFRYGGIAHIFAVSGLHIGIIYSIFTFIFKKTYLNKYVSAGLRTFFIIFYSGICGFTLSSIRAVIMCAVGILTGLFHVKIDQLNNLAFAVILILFITPLSLFSVGFQLSICAVGGIILLTRRIKRVCNKIKIPEIISGSVGTTVGAQAGTFPVMMAKFGYVSGAGLILNLLIMIVISPLFTIVFTGTVISVVIPPAAEYVMPYAVLPLEGVLSFLLSANFENALITGFGSGAFVPVYFAVILFFSDKLNINAASRLVFASIGTTALAACVLIMTYSPLDGYKISVSGTNTGGSVIIKSNCGNVLIMTQNANISRVVNFLNSEYSYNLGGVIILGDEDCVESFNLSLPCKDVYISSLYLPVQPFSTCEVHYERYFSLSGIDFEFVDGHSLLFNLDGVSVSICEGEKIPLKSCDLLISMCENYDSESNSVQCITGNTVYFNMRDHKYNVYDYGKITYYASGGKLTMEKVPYRICAY